MRLSPAKTFAVALMLSLTVHLLVGVGDSLYGLFPVPQDETPLKPLKARLRAMALDSQPASPPPPAKGVTTLAAAKPRAARKTASAPQEASAPLHHLVASAPQAKPVASEPALIASAPVGELLPKRFPDRAVLTYDAYYGAFMAGIAVVDWQREGRHYRLDSRITVAFTGMVLRYVSEGEITPQGLKPSSFAAYRNETPKEKASFDWQGRQLVYGENEPQTAELRKGAQDVFSVMYQLALKGAGADGDAIQVTTGKKVRDRPVAPSGEAELETRDGPIHAVVIRSQDADSLTEFWLAPEYANQPIRVRRTDKNLNLDLRINRIELNGTTVWKQSPPIQRKPSK